MNHVLDPELLTGLPELYQPVYGHPEHSAPARRACEDRLESLLAVHDALREALGRPLRVLDLGCAQGYFSLHLAARGAVVHGVDSDPASIALCQALAQEHPELKVRFSGDTVEAVLERLVPDQYDLMLGLSVLHHLIHAHGMEAIAGSLAHARRCVPVLLLELARRQEPLPWAASQPDEPRQLLGDVAFVHPLGEYPTHLSSICRPLLLASDTYWVLPPHAGPIDSHTSESHDLAQAHYQGTRHYYRSGEYLIKHFSFDAPASFDNRGELTREVEFLQQVPEGFDAPTIIDHGLHAQAGWLIRQWWPGHLLLDELRQGAIPDHMQVTLQTLEQLASLEAAGFYHNDLRPWNLLRREDGCVRLIDYGAIVAQPEDRAWPGSPYLAVFILIHELVSGEVHHPEPIRPAAISPWGLPPPYRQWAAEFWSKPVDQWCFAELRTRLQAYLDGTAEAPPPLLPPQRWVANMEQALDIQGRAVAFLHWRHDQYSHHVSAVEARAWESEAHARESEAHARESEQRALAAEHHARDSELKAQQALYQLREAEAQSRRQRQELLSQLRHAQEQQREQQGRIQALNHELEELHQYTHHVAAAEQALRQSLSWRLTRPLRLGVESLRYLLQWLRRLPKGLLDGLMHGMARFVLKHPPLKALALRVLARLPRLRQRMERRLLGPPTRQPAASTEDQCPPPVTRARHLLQRQRRQS